MKLIHYRSLALIFRYPEVHYAARIKDAVDMLQPRCPEAAQELACFYEAVSKCGLSVLQELFTRSFDVQAMTTLDAGYLLFGDDYKRGEILSKLNEEYRRLELDSGNELADHLPNLLQLIACIKEDQLVKELVEYLILPAVRLMRRDFEPEKIAAKKKAYKKHYRTWIEADPRLSPVYAHAFDALLLVLVQDFGEAKYETPMSQSDFVQSIAREMSIEKIAGE